MQKAQSKIIILLLLFIIILLFLLRFTNICELREGHIFLLCGSSLKYSTIHCVLPTHSNILSLKFKDRA